MQMGWIRKRRRRLRRIRNSSFLQSSIKDMGELDWFNNWSKQNKSFFHYNVPFTPKVSHHDKQTRQFLIKTALNPVEIELIQPFAIRNKEWGNINGIRCFNETRPVTKKGHWGSGSNKEMMNVVASVMRRMKVPVTVLNVTQLSEYRIDAHTSIYGELQGKLLTDEQRADPLHFADCIHWCLPGVPDTWNQLLFAYL